MCFYSFLFIKMYAHIKNTCLKLRNICFAKFIDSLKITSRVIKFTSQFANMKQEFTPCTLTHTLLNENSKVKYAKSHEAELMLSYTLLLLLVGPTTLKAGFSCRNVGFTKESRE